MKKKLYEVEIRANEFAAIAGKAAQQWSAALAPRPVGCDDGVPSDAELIDLHDEYRKAFRELVRVAVEFI